MIKLFRSSCLRILSTYLYLQIVYSLINVKEEKCKRPKTQISYPSEKLYYPFPKSRHILTRTNAHTLVLSSLLFFYFWCRSYFTGYPSTFESYITFIIIHTHLFFYSEKTRTWWVLFISILPPGPITFIQYLSTIQWNIFAQ